MHNKKDMTKAMAYMTRQDIVQQQHDYLVADEILVALDALVANSHL